MAAPVNADVAEADILFIGDAIFPGGNDYPAVEIGLDTVASALAARFDETGDRLRIELTVQIAGPALPRCDVDLGGQAPWAGQRHLGLAAA